MSIPQFILVLMLTARFTCANSASHRRITRSSSTTAANLETNTVATSTETGKGANSRITTTSTTTTSTKENLEQSGGKVDDLSTVVTVASIKFNENVTKEISKSANSDPAKSTEDDSQKEDTNQSSQAVSQSSGQSDDTNSGGISPTTPRHIRNSSAPPGRDKKLMSLLAARRNALQRDRWRTHRRGGTTNKSEIETTPKSSSDPRTSCERNCTKNFTRRTTASCMRRCASLHRAFNSSIATSTPKTTTQSTRRGSYSSPSPRTKVDEKDNNEILEFDESAHGFYVVTKDFNETANHISPELVQSSTLGLVTAATTERTDKIKSKLKRPSVSVEEVDLTPYTLYGQKLPASNKPTVIRINRVSDPKEHPRILEISVPKTTERSSLSMSNRQRYYQTRNLVAYNRRHGIGFTKAAAVNPSINTDKSKVLATKSSKEKLIKEVASQDNSTVNVLVRSAEESTNFINHTLEITTPLPPITANIATQEVGNFAERIKLTAADNSKPFKINVPDAEIEEQPSQIVTEAPPAEKVQEEPQEHFTISPSFLQPAPPPDEDRPNLIIFLNVTTPQPISKISSVELSQHPTTQKSFTKTTVSSSVRSTVYPKSGVLTPTITSDTVKLSLDPENVSVPSSIFISTFFRDPTSPSFPHPTSTARTPNGIIEGIVVEDNEVTIESHRMNLATYVLAGLGMLPIIVIILYVGKTVVLKRRMKDDDDFEHYAPDVQPISPVRKMDQNEDRNDQYSISSEQEFERSNLRFKSLLGEGNFGQVWKAEADDLAGHIGTTRIVAVKTVRAGSVQCGLKEEADIMKKLGSHPNVVTLLGACTESEPHLLIMEYAMRGRLLSLLRAARSATNILPASVPGGRSLAPLSPRTLAGFALDIARGMEYISDKRIVHRDLAARNVLLDHNGVCKICDFGMSIDLEVDRKSQPQTRKADIIRHPSTLDHRFRFDFGGRILNQWNHMQHSNSSNNSNSNNNNKDTVSKRPALPIRWMAPEALQYHIFSTETDVWAFGIVLWEIATLGCTPYPNLSGREVVRNVPNGARPEISQDGRHEFCDLMQRCWRKDPRQRPTFHEARVEIYRSVCKWVDDDTAASDYMDVSGFSEDLEHGMVYFNRRISEFECEI